MKRWHVLGFMGIIIVIGVFSALLGAYISNALPHP